MANTYTQIYLHVVFAVEGRQNLIKPEHNDELQKYITGIVSAQKHKLIAINNMRTTCTCSLVCDRMRRSLIWCATSKPTRPASSARSAGCQAVFRGRKVSVRSPIRVHNSAR